MKLMAGFFSCVVFLLLMGCSPISTKAPEIVMLPTSTPEPTKVVFLPTITPVSVAPPNTSGIPLPPDGMLYHGVYPGGRTGEEDDVTFKDLLDYTNAVGKTTTWVHFSNNWYRSRKFPTETAEWIRNSGSIPYIRLMLRSELKFKGIEPVYTLQKIIDGVFDKDLQKWCLGARDFGTSVLVEYGTEVNSDSFPWSGVANGAGEKNGYGDPTLPDGPERFRDAYRHIIQTCRTEGAVNITWVFHLDSESTPDVPWNRFENYYPGNEWIDWIGISVYGAYTPLTSYYSIFRVSIDRVHARILKLAPGKPIIIAEFGTTQNNPFVDQVKWTRAALTDITSFRYQNLIGFSWWNEAWQNDGNPAHDTTMRVQDNPDLEALFQEIVGNNPNIMGEIHQ